MSKILKFSVLLLFVGGSTGILSSAFLYSLSFVTRSRMDNPMLIWGLPFYGLLLGMVIKKIPHYVNQGVLYIVTEIDNPNEKVSTLTAPFIFITSLGTHLFGGSAGREGVGVLMGASVAHILPKTHSVFKKMRVHLIYAGVAAGFASMFGTPLAGVLVAYELHRFKEVKKIDLLFSTLLSALIADRITRYLGPNHHQYQVIFDWDLSLISITLLVGLVSGLGALSFYYGMKYFTQFISKLIHSIEWKLFVGGALVASFIYFFNAYDYSGIGIEMIERSFQSPMQLSDFFSKMVLTIITLSVGFKGGEVTPLLFMGATLSNAALGFFNFSNYSLSSALGMSALFGAVINAPLTSTVMACEFFGWKIGILALVSCLVAKLFMGHKSVYRH